MTENLNENTKTQRWLQVGATFGLFLVLSLLGETKPALNGKLQILTSNHVNKTPEEILLEPSSNWRDVQSDDLAKLIESASYLGEFWYKLTYQNSAAVSRGLVLEIDLSNWTDVEFIRVERGQVQDRYKISGFGDPPFVEQRLLYHQKAYPFELAPGEGAEILIKASLAALASPMPVLVMERSEFERRAGQRMAFWGVFFGAFLMVIIYNLVLFFSSRDALYLLYSCYQICLLVPLYVLTDLGVSTLFRDRFDLILVWFNCGTAAAIWFGVQFVHKYYERFGDFRATGVKRFLQFLSVAVILAAFFVPSIWLQAPVQFGLVVCVLSFFWLSVSHPHRMVPSSFLIGWSGILASALVVLLTMVRAIPMTVITDYVVYFGSLWEVIFLTKAIGDQMRRFNHEKANVRNRLGWVGPLYAQAAPTSVRQNAAILVIDIVNFSQLVARIGVEKTFRYLNILTTTIHSLIDRYDGIIDRSLGDGILAIFGADGGQSKPHCVRAFEAAVAIQNIALEMVLDKKYFGGVPILLRIGIHEGSVQVGNLGDQGKFDFTALGPSINFAGELEKMCFPQRILMSNEVRAALPQTAYVASAMRSAYFARKENAQLATAYEYEPNVYREDQSRACEELFRQFFNQRRMAARQPVSRLGIIKLVTEVGEFDIRDFSETGFGCRGQRYFARGTIISALIKTEREDINQELVRALLDQIELEVRFGQPCEDGYHIGFAMRSLAAAPRQFLVSLLTRLQESSDEGNKRDQAASF